MAGELTHRELQGLLGAYALDAVDGDEAEAIELHLRGCPRCRAEVSTHRETAAWLSGTGGAAPEGMWDRLVSSLEEPPPALRLVPAPLPDAIGSAPAAPAPVDVGGPATPTATITPLAAMRSRRLLPALAGAAAAIVFALGVFTATRDDAPTTELAGDVRLGETVRRALAEPDARRVRLTSSDGNVHAAVVLLPSGEGYIFEDNLPALPDGRTYQLWAAVGSERLSLGVLGDDPDISGFKAAIDGVEALAITAEQAPGVKESTQSFVVSAHLG